jgi:hypothetical protein
LSGNGGKRLGDIVNFLFSASTNAAHTALRQGGSIRRFAENARGKKTDARRGRCFNFSNAAKIAQPGRSRGGMDANSRHKKTPYFKLY